MSEFHTLSGVYAVDAVDDIERATFDRHLVDCAECQVEVAEFQATAALLSAESLTPAPIGLRDRVLGEIATVRPLPPRTAGGHRAERRSPWTVLVAAAAAVVTLGVGGTVIWNQFAEPDTQVISATDRVLSAPDAEQATVQLLGGAEATLWRSEELGQAVLVTKALPAPPPGRAYQMWLFTTNGTIAPAGMMTAAPNQTILLEGDAAAATAAAISVEPEGGSAQPTTEPVALIDFSSLESA